MYIYLNVCKKMINVKLLLLYSKTWNHVTLCKRMIKSKYNYLYKMQIFETNKLC